MAWKNRVVSERDHAATKFISFDDSHLDAICDAMKMYVSTNVLLLRSDTGASCSHGQDITDSHMTAHLSQSVKQEALAIALRARVDDLRSERDAAKLLHLVVQGAGKSSAQDQLKAVTYDAARTAALRLRCDMDLAIAPILRIDGEIPGGSGSRSGVHDDVLESIDLYPSHIEVAFQLLATVAQEDGKAPKESWQEMWLKLKDQLETLLHQEDSPFDQAFNVSPVDRSDPVSSTGDENVEGLAFEITRDSLKGAWDTYKMEVTEVVASHPEMANFVLRTQKCAR